MTIRQGTFIPFPCLRTLFKVHPHMQMAVGVQISSAMKALLCHGASVPAGICASKANTVTGFGFLGRCWSLSFPRSTGPFIRAPLCGCSRDPPTPLPEDSDNRQDERERDVDIARPQVTHSWMESWEMLLDHIMGLEGKTVVQLGEPVNKLLQDLGIGIKEYDALLALAQVYINLEDYEKAKAIQGWIQDCEKLSQMDSRPELQEAIAHLTLAMEKLQQGTKESKTLIESVKESWRAYKKLKEVGGAVKQIMSLLLLILFCQLRTES